MGREEEDSRVERDRRVGMKTCRAEKKNTNKSNPCGGNVQHLDGKNGVK